MALALVWLWPHYLIWPWSVCDVHLICLWCTSDLAVMYIWSGRDVHLIWPWCTSDLAVMYIWSSRDVALIWLWCTSDLAVMYIWSSCDVQYIWSSRDVALIWLWCSYDLSVIWLQQAWIEQIKPHPNPNLVSDRSRMVLITEHHQVVPDRVGSEWPLPSSGPDRRGVEIQRTDANLQGEHIFFQLSNLNVFV